MAHAVASLLTAYSDAMYGDRLATPAVVTPEEMLMIFPVSAAIIEGTTCFVTMMGP